MKKMMSRILLLSAALALSFTAMAEQIFMARTPQTFPETMLELQQEIRDHGYTLSRVQRVDIGLTKSGYKTDKYRVVFFGKIDQINWVSKNHPEWIPYLPLKIAIFAEGPDTVLIASDPEVIFVTKDQELKKMIAQWKKDMQSIFDKLGH